MRHVQDKNPSDNDGRTPLHFAAMKCHEDLCKLIMDSLDEKNPVDNVGNTPKQYMLESHQEMMQKIFDD